MSDQDFDPPTGDMLRVDVEPRREPDGDKPSVERVAELDSRAPHDDSEPLLLDFKQALRLLGVSESTLYRHAPRIPGSLKLGGTWRFNRQILLDFLACKGPGSRPKKR